MIILHNAHSRESREFVERHGADAVVLDWYAGGRETWLALGGTARIAAFPSVVYAVPEHLAPETGDIVPRRQHVLRRPRSRHDLVAAVAAINARLAASTAAGHAAAPIRVDDDAVAVPANAAGRIPGPRKNTQP